MMESIDVPANPEEGSMELLKLYVVAFCLKPGC